MANFGPAFAYILPNEGGYVDNPNDRGGATNFGITQGTLDTWNEQNNGFPEDVADLEIDQASTIYEAMYWPTGMDQIKSQAVASKMLDIMVNFGVSGGLKIIQSAANSVVIPGTTVDGRMGPSTVSTINAAEPTAMLKAMVTVLQDRYNGIVQRDASQSGFLNGWLARAARTPVVASGIGLVVLLAIGGLIWMSQKGRGA